MKRILINITQTLMSLLWLPGLLLLNNCNGGNVSSISLTLPSSVGEQQVIATSTPSEVILFCGNPGVGKSSLCNSVFQSNVFKSGISIGQGMTQEKQEYIYENRKYIDTPGLADVKLRQQAAEQIEKALKENNNYKIIFVATLEAGRIRPDDLVTINTVCNAVKTDFEYGIIFNKVTRPVMREIAKIGLKAYLEPLNKQPASTIIIKKDEDMEDAEDVHMSSSSEDREKLINFISDLKANIILVENVDHVDVSIYEEKVREMEEKLTEVKKQLEVQRQETERLRQLLEEQIQKEIRAQQEAERLRQLEFQRQQEIRAQQEEQRQKGIENYKYNHNNKNSNMQESKYN